MTKCAYRALETVTPLISDFPLEIMFGTQLKTDSYSEALETARQWFIDNPDYVLITEKY
jgi:hypothetical protein